MTKPKVTSKELKKLELDCIYRYVDACKAMGVERRTLDKLKLRGLDVRMLGNTQYVKSNDIWNAMLPRARKDLPQKTDT